PDRQDRADHHHHAARDPQPARGARGDRRVPPRAGDRDAVAPAPAPSRGEPAADRGVSMPAFRYRAYGARGELAEGVIEAASSDAAGDLLWGRGLTPFHMRQADAAGQKWWQREVFAARAPSHGDLALFTRDFATLNAAEIPLDDA